MNSSEIAARQDQEMEAEPVYPDEQRLNIRFSCSETKARLFVGDAETPVEARILDVSADGLRIRVGSMIALGCGVRVEMQKFQLSGEVRFCRPDGTGSFQVGLLLPDCCEI